MLSKRVTTRELAKRIDNLTDRVEQMWKALYNDSDGLVVYVAKMERDISWLKWLTTLGTGTIIVVALKILLGL